MNNTIYGFVGKGKLGSLLGGRPNFVFIDCDIMDRESIKEASKGQKFNVVVNCAALSSVDSCEKSTSRAWDLNIIGLDNLHQVFANRVLNISSDQVFSGNRWLLPSEKSKYRPINVYGMTKAVGEDLTVNTYHGKVLRLSRTVDLSDLDISFYESALKRGESISIPTFIRRNYLSRKQAVDGIVYAVRNFDALPSIVNFGSSDNSTMYNFYRELFYWMGYDASIERRRNYIKGDGIAPRPKKGGFRVGLAKRLGFPMYSKDEAIQSILGT